MNQTLLLSLVVTIAPLASADQSSFTNSGGSTSGASGILINASAVSSPAGTLSLNCPTTSARVCSGGNFTFASSDGTSAVNAVFTSGSYSETCYGGGKGGGPIKCYFSFTGYFSGAWTVNGAPQAITGITYQSFPAPGTAGTAAGTTAFNSAYSPFYYSDTEAILRSDDLMGTNQISYDGAAIGGLYGAYGLALDAQGRIYVADTYNCRIVRIDDMTGANAVTYGGTCGSGQGQFYDPQGIAVDSNGKIYIMDTGNSRLVRIDDMTGANWVTYGAPGSGVGQFVTFTSVSIDSSNRIYIADTGNLRVVRMDDMTGANWTTLSQSQPVNGVTYRFVSPVAVGFDSAGRIYIADDNTAAAVVRVDDMTGLNWTSITVSAVGTTGLNSISVDSGGTVFTGGGGARIVDGMQGVLTSSGAVGPIGSYYVFGVTRVPLPSPIPSAISFTPPALSISQNVGSASPAQPITVYNFGGSPLSIANVSAGGGGFAQTNTCLGTLAAGSTCTIDVTFTPPAGGAASGALTITDNSGNLGAAQTVALTGTGTAPAASASPTSLNFGAQMLGTSSAARTVVLTDSGTGPLNVAGITVTGPFNQTSNCPSVAAGSSCNISVTFTPAALGAASGTLSINDAVGTQTVALRGNGTGPLSISPTSLEFNPQVAGTSSAPQTVTATNQGSTAISISNIAISAGFVISSNSCGATLGVGSSCSVSVTFAPTASGDDTGALTFTDSAIGSPQSVSLQGTGTASVTASPGSLNFGTVTYGATSSSQTVTFTNLQSVAVNLSSIAASAHFTVASNTCGTSVAAGGKCTVGVKFSPNAAGAFTGTLKFSDDAPNSPQAVNLRGTGGGTPVTLSTGSVSFGTLATGTTSSPHSVTLTNHLNTTLRFSSIVASAGFAISSNTCGTSVAATTACTVAVTFSPTAAGTVTGTLTFNDGAANSPQKVSLTGTGQ